MATPTKDAQHFIDMYAIGPRLMKETLGQFDAITPTGRILDIKTARDPVFIIPDPGHDPYNYHGREMQRPVFDFRQIEYRVMAYFDAQFMGHDPYNHVGDRL